MENRKRRTENYGRGQTARRVLRSPFVFSLLASLCLCVSLVPPLAAHHITIDLKVESGSASKTVHAETAAIGVKPKQRAVLRIKAGQRVAVRWTLTNAAAKDTFKNVLVHFFAVKEERLGQQPPLKPGKGVVAESALTMDFNPKDSTKGELTFTIDMPGFYLLRLQTIGAAVGVEGHEHYATLDLVVE